MNLDAEPIDLSAEARALRDYDRHPVLRLDGLVCTRHTAAGEIQCDAHSESLLPHT